MGIIRYISLAFPYILPFFGAGDFFNAPWGPFGLRTFGFADPTKVDPGRVFWTKSQGNPSGAPPRNKGFNSRPSERKPMGFHKP